MEILVEIKDYIMKLLNKADDVQEYLKTSPFESNIQPNVSEGDAVD